MLVRILFFCFLIYSLWVTKYACMLTGSARVNSLDLEIEIFGSSGIPASPSVSGCYLFVSDCLWYLQIEGDGDTPSHFMPAIYHSSGTRPPLISDLCIISCSTSNCLQKSAFCFMEYHFLQFLADSMSQKSHEAGHSPQVPMKCLLHLQKRLMWSLHLWG